MADSPLGTVVGVVEPVGVVVGVVVEPVGEVVGVVSVVEVCVGRVVGGVVLDVDEPPHADMAKAAAANATSTDALVTFRPPLRRRHRRSV